MICVMCAFFLNEVAPSYCWALLPMFSLFGRIYFWAHHLFDCLAGGFLGYFCCATVCFFRSKYPMYFEELQGLATLILSILVFVALTQFGRKTLKIKHVYG